MGDKRGLKITQKFTNRILYSLISIFLVLTIAAGVYAFGTTSPSSFGHSRDEVEGTLNLPTCSDGEVLEYSSGSWICGTDDSGSSVWTESGGIASYSGDIKTSGRTIYFGDTQTLLGNDATAFYFDSNSDTATQLILRDKQNTIYGRVYGSGDGTNFGFLDGDGNWGYLQSKDSYTQFRINDVPIMILRSTGNVGIGTDNPGDKLDVVGNLRGNRYYDRNNLNYYVDPASTSILNTIKSYGSNCVKIQGPTSLLEIC